MDDINQLSMRLDRTHLEIQNNNDLISTIRNWTQGTKLLSQIDNLLLQGYILVKEGPIYKVKRPFDP